MDGIGSPGRGSGQGREGASSPSAAVGGSAGGLGQLRVGHSQPKPVERRLQRPGSRAGAEKREGWTSAAHRRRTQPVRAEAGAGRAPPSAPLAAHRAPRPPRPRLLRSSETAGVLRKGGCPPKRRVPFRTAGPLLLRNDGYPPKQRVFSVAVGFLRDGRSCSSDQNRETQPRLSCVLVQRPRAQLRPPTFRVAGPAGRPALELLADGRGGCGGEGGANKCGAAARHDRRGARSAGPASRARRGGMPAPLTSPSLCAGLGVYARRFKIYEKSVVRRCETAKEREVVGLVLVRECETAKEREVVGLVLVRGCETAKERAGQQGPRKGGEETQVR